MSKTSLTGPQRPMVSIPFMLLGMLFCVCLIAANLLETKQVTLGPLDLTAGLIVFRFRTLSTTAWSKYGATAVPA